MKTKIIAAMMALALLALVGFGSVEQANAQSMPSKVLDNAINRLPVIRDLKAYWLFSFPSWALGTISCLVFEIGGYLLSMIPVLGIPFAVCLMLLFYFVEFPYLEIVLRDNFNEFIAEYENPAIKSLALIYNIISEIFLQYTFWTITILYVPFFIMECIPGLNIIAAVIAAIFAVLLYFVPIFPIVMFQFVIIALGGVLG